MSMQRFYAAIDLKSFYASVECHERGLDPLTTDLVVADESRTDKTICLAISPSMKAKYGLPGRARLFEVNAKAGVGNFIIAKPRMQYYVDYSRKIYETYLQFVAPEDIFAYSIDEVFCEITSYLKYRQQTPEEFVREMIRRVYQETGITATAGIGTNLYLAKVAMDITAKHKEPDEFGVRVAMLDEKTYREKLWTHTPITDFWRIGPGTMRRLKERQMCTMGDVARCSIVNMELLYKMFGVNAELIIDHAWGVETATIRDVKNYRPESKSLSEGQVLSRPYGYDEAKIIIKEMAESLALTLVAGNYPANTLTMTLGYADETSAHGTKRLKVSTLKMKKLRDGFVELYEEIVDSREMTKRIVIAAENLQKTRTQLELFDGQIVREKENLNLEKAVLELRKKFGGNVIVRGTDFEKGATGRERRMQIGGHHV